MMCMEISIYHQSLPSLIVRKGTKVDQNKKDPRNREPFCR